MIWIHRLFLGFLTGLLGVLINLAPLGPQLEENLGLSWLFTLRGPISPPKEAVVIAMDKASADELELPITPSLWPRNLHTRLIENLSNAGAQVIAFDLRFDSPSTAPEQDVELANAMRKAGNVVTVERLDSKEPGFVTDEQGRSYSGASMLKRAPLLPIIEEAAIANTMFPLPRASRVNDYWAFKTRAGDRPTLPVVVLQLFALGVYGDFARLLTNESPSRAAQLPTNGDDITVEDLILRLRGIFTDEPKLAERMLAQLNLELDLDPGKKRLIQSLLNVYSGDDVRYLNFYGPPRTVQTISYHHALRLTHFPTAGGVSSADVKGKAVFVGYSGATQSEQDRIRDDYHTVFSQADGLYLSGVEIAATAFSNLLEDRTLKTPALVINLAIVFVWGFAITLAYAALPLRHVTTLAASGALLGLGLAFLWTFIAYHQFMNVQIWLPFIVPLLQIPVAMLDTLFLSYYIMKRDREILKNAFNKFVPQRVISQILKSTGQISASNKLVYGTCLATDAEMYTALAEQMDPAQLAVLMNDYYATMFEPVGRHDGIVSDVIGDAMLAIWAASSADESLRKKACHACLDIADALERFNQPKNRPKLRTRIGLHSGEMLLGTVGALQHYEYRAVGDMVNTTNRIQGLNKYLGTRLLVSNQVIDGLDEFLTRPLGSFLLAGRASSLRVAELVSRKTEAIRDQVWLCEIFAEAIQSYEAQEWPGGCRNFSEILKVFPSDGPAQFFLKRCHDYQDGVVIPVGPWDASIRMDVK